MITLIKPKIFVYVVLMAVLLIVIIIFMWLSGNTGKWLPNPPNIPSLSTTTVQSGTLKGQYRERPGMITVSSPKIGATITSPISIVGQARGGWFFEGTFPILVRDENGNEIGSGSAITKDDWMTNDFVPFTAYIVYSAPSSAQSSAKGKIILEKEDPSGDNIPEYIEIPVFFGDVKGQ